MWIWHKGSGSDRLLKNTSCWKFENGFPLKACGNDGFLYANVNSTWLWRHMEMHDILFEIMNKLRSPVRHSRML
jgi:hypothetical protein